MVNSNQNGTEKINSLSENLTKIKVSFDFSGSLTSQIIIDLGCVCAHVFQKRTWGVLIRAGALNRANTVLHYDIKCLIYPLSRAMGF